MSALKSQHSKHSLGRKPKQKNPNPNKSFKLKLITRALFAGFSLLPFSIKSKSMEFISDWRMIVWFVLVLGFSRCGLFSVHKQYPRRGIKIEILMWVEK
jgi:hypothetical protein